MSYKNTIRFLFGFLAVYCFFIIQLAVLCNTTKAQRSTCIQTCAQYGSRGETKNNAFFFTQRRDVTCSCVIDGVQTIDRAGHPVSR